MSASTGHFPGAPFNSDPITTMATSTSQPVTSPSSASQVAPPATLYNPGPPVPTSQAATDPKGVPTSEEARATSSAANTAGTEPSATSADGTATSTTEATTTTSAASNAMTSTTTTTTTTTIPTGRITPIISNDFLFNDAIKKSNNCLFLVRKLRSKQNVITSLFLEEEDNEDNFFRIIQAYRDFGLMMQEVMVLYERLDAISRRLPKVVPPTDNINVMRTLYSQEHTMCHIDINGLLEKMIDSGNWNEGNFQIFHYLSELLRVNINRKPNRYPDIKPLPPPIFHMQATTSHMTFEKAYAMMKQDILNKSLGIYPKTLNRSSSSLVVEFLFGCGGTKVVTESDIVYTMKFLLVERNGSIEYINMVAPNEKWISDSNYGTTKFDPFAPSCYEVYRRLTRQANIHLLSCFGSHANRWSSTTLLQFISLFGKFREVFTTRCRVCRRYLKNFMPPLIFDIRTPTNAAHEACR